MRYLIALLIPPLGLLVCGKPFQAAINFVLIVIAIICALSVIAAPIGVWLGGATLLHALLVAHNDYADERQRRLERLFTAPAASLPDNVLGDTDPTSSQQSADWDEMYGGKKKNPLSWLG